MQMPKTDESVIARREELAAGLREIVPGEGVIDGEEEATCLRLRWLDGLQTIAVDRCVPETTKQVSDILKYCHANHVRCAPRGGYRSFRRCIAAR